MKGCRLCITWGLMVVALAAVAWGQDQPALQAPTTQPKPAGESKPLQVTVKEVSGVAQCLRAGKEQAWQPLKVGDKLDELTVIRTGFGTRVVLAFEDNSVVEIDRATKMGIAEFRKEGQLTRTRVGLKYGSMRMNVSKARGPNDFAVSTPVATLAVRGSGSSAGFSDFGLLMSVESGTWGVTMGPQTGNYTSGEVADGQLTPPGDLAKQRGSVQLGDVYGGLSALELMSLINYGGGRGIIGMGGAGEGSSVVIPPPVPPEVKPGGDVDVPGLDIDIGT